jgi:hypothetical protein
MHPSDRGASKQVDRGQDRGKDREPKKRNWKWILAAVAGLAVGAAGVIDRMTPDKSGDDVETVDPVNPEDLKHAGEQLRRAADMLDAAAKDPRVADPEAPKIERTLDFTKMGITRDLLDDFPDADKEGGTGMFGAPNPDKNISEKLESDPAVRARYEQLVRDYVIEVEEKVVTAYLPGDEGRTMTFSIDVADNPHNDFSIYTIEEVVDDGTARIVLSETSDDGFDTARAQSAIRQAMQDELYWTVRRAMEAEAQQ